MIRAASASKVKLMIAYRLHFEAANLKAVQVVRSGKLGEPRIFNSVFTMQVEKGNIRLKKDLGGGHTLRHRHLLHQCRSLSLPGEPVEVCAFSANNGEERFQEVDEMTTAILRFPNERLAPSPVASAPLMFRHTRLWEQKAAFRVDPAYERRGRVDTRAHRLNGKSRKQTFPAAGSVCTRTASFLRLHHEGQDPEPSGAEGLADVRIIRAL